MRRWWFILSNVVTALVVLALGSIAIGAAPTLVTIIQGGLGLSASNPLPVQLQSGGLSQTVKIDQTTPGTTNGVVANAGSNIIGKVGVDQTTPGTSNGVVTNSGSVTAATEADGANSTLGAIANAAWTSGNGTAIAILKALDRDILAATINLITNGDAQVLTNTLKTASQNLVYNGTSFDLLREATNGANSTGTGIGAAAQMGQCDDSTIQALTSKSFGNQRESCIDHSHLNGGIAQSAEKTPVVAGTVNGYATDLVGKQIVLPYANPENFVSGVTAAMTGTTSTSLIGAPAGSLRNYLTQLICTNSHATVGTFVIVQDGSGGTTIYEGYAAAVGGGFSLSFPVPLKQPTVATALFVQDVTTGANVICAGSGYKGT